MYNIPIIFHPKFPKSIPGVYIPFPAHIRELPEVEVETIQEFGRDSFTVPIRTRPPNLIIDFNDDLSLASHFIKWKDGLSNRINYKETQKIEIKVEDVLYEINIYGAFPVNVIYEAAESDIGMCQVEMVYDYFDKELISIIEEFFKEEEFNI